MLDHLGLATPIWPVPVEIPDAIPFTDDLVHRRYDPEPRPALLARPGRDATGVQRLPCSLRRQGQPGARLLGSTRIAPAGARWDDGLAEFILPCETVRTADDPDALLLAFLQSTYAAAATNARWDRHALDRLNGNDQG